MSGIDIHTLRYAANKVAKFASRLIKKEKLRKTGDARAFEQGVGAEMASRMLMEEAEKMERAKSR